jgi:dienelactone hydrolase
MAFAGLVDASPTRKLPTLVSYPAAAAGTDVPVAAGGPYPLIVLSHGITADFHEFDQLYPALIAAGYVVAAPNFPETTGGDDFRALPAIVEQPPDVQFVIGSMLHANDDPASPLHGTIDASEIGIGGHSFGAMTSLLLAYNSRYGDSRVKAVYEASGSMYPVDGGTYDFAGGPPLLIVHGDADQTVGYQGALDLYPLAPTPKCFLTIAGAGHSTFFQAGDPGLQPQIDAVVGFYDLYLQGDPAGAAQIREAAVPGVSTLQSQP